MTDYLEVRGGQPFGGTPAVTGPSVTGQHAGAYSAVRGGHGRDHPEGPVRGVFHTIRENEFALQTFEFDWAPDEVALLWFEDLDDGRTGLRGRSGRTVKGRDAMLESGMEQGKSQGYDRLGAFVARAT